MVLYLFFVVEPCMSDYPDVEQKLATARTRLILDKPFLGALVLRLPMVAGDPKWCETTFSDGKTFLLQQ